ncbi:MAG: RNA-binding protein S1 [Streptococcaceae bacterium]|jgi:S1 RNA binding domain protein|nr:RNA-binding protein S1 [Streptococcaceae bacterium]
MSIEVGSVLQGKVTGITKFGAFVKLSNGSSGLVHISEASTDFIKEISDVLAVGDEVNVKVISVADNGKIVLSIKQTMEAVDHKKDFSFPKGSSSFENNRKNANRRNNKAKPDKGFDALMSSFLKNSEKKLSSLRRNTEGKRGGRGGRRS